MKAHLVSLGCPKNLTDTEVLMGKLVASGYEITADPAKADIIIINTCAFLKTARAEAICTIKEMAKWRSKGKKIYIAGCLPKYLNSSLGIRHSSLSRLVDGEISSIGLFDYCAPRIKATPPWTAYVKIAEGCGNYCAYCLIPSIRGKLRLRPAADILKEVKQLAERGVKEVIFIAQDTTAHPQLATILSRSARLPGLRWIRLMYAHPRHLTDRVIKVIAREPKIVKYLDLPIQHASDKILGLMDRRYTRHDLVNLITKIRRQIPQIALRSSVIAGFPGEGETEFQELLDFIREVKFERLGCFTFQREKGTPAFKMRGQVSGRVKIKRFQKLMRAQARIAREKGNKMIGRTLDIMIERAVRGGFNGRSYMDAPEIDGTVFASTDKSLKPGEIVKVRVTKARTYDLYGCLT